MNGKTMNSWKQSKKKIFNFLYVWCTHVNKKNEKNRTSLQIKL